MQTELDCVRAFHEAMNISRSQAMPSSPNSRLQDIGAALLKTSKILEKDVGNKDGRYLRAHLMIEELGELVTAMGKGDSVEALDGLADLCYVVFGTAVTFGFPLAAAFSEVHRSNMTKQRRADDPGRVRDKGDSYRAPDIAAVLKIARSPEYMSFPTASLSPEQKQRLLDTYKEMITCLDEQ